VQQAQPPAPTALPPPAARQQPGESHPTTQASPPVGQQPGQPPRPTAQQPTPPTSPPTAQQPVQQQQQAPAAQQQQQAPAAQQQQPGQLPRPTAQQPTPPTSPPTAQQPVQQQPQSPAAQQQQQAPAAQQQQPGQPSSRPVAGPQPQGTPQQNQLAAPTPPDRARRIEEVRGERREVRQGDRVVIEEPGRMIIREAGRAIIRHNEIDRFRAQSRDVRVERRGGDTVTVIERPDGTRIVSVVDEDGRLIRRSRQGRDGREIVIIDNRYRGPATVGSYYVELPPPVIRIPRERYIVEADRVPPTEIYAALRAQPVERIDRRYTLEEIRYSPMVRDRMPRIDLDTVTFESGSWEVASDQANRLAPIAEGIRQAVAQNPSEVFLIEGHTDAVGADVDNLSLSDRRAESVAVVLSEQFQVPGENLTTQGYGEQYLKVPTDAPERVNRRVTVRRITPLLTGQNQAGN
jgi:outer membrane protein OmpA-like peptidoglycan-associated protein